MFGGSLIKKVCLAGFLALFLFPAACGESGGGGCGGLFRSGKGGVPVVVEEVRLREVLPIETVTGILVPNNRAELTSPYEAKIQDFFVRVGSDVVAGDPLFRLSDSGLSNDLNLARARKKELEALIEKNSGLLKGREKMLEEGKINQDELSRLEKELAVNDSELERINTEIVKLNYNLENLTVASPIAGIVIEKNADVGSVVEPNKVVVVVANIDPIVAIFPLTPKQSENMVAGSIIKTGVNELAGKVFDARVSFIKPEMHQVGKTFDVITEISNEGYLLKTGMTAFAEFESDTSMPTFLIPLSAVMSRTYKPYVYRASRGLVHRTPVTLGSIENDYVEVVSGLSKGDIVVVKGVEALTDGAEVSIWK